jgi:hypothetical protein
MSIGTDGNPGNPVHVKIQESVKLKESFLTWVTLVFSFIALVVSIVTALFTWSPWGEVRTIKPSSYAIIRQDTLGSPGVTAKTEHLVLPVEWENDRGNPVLIRSLELTVSEREGDGGGTHKFYMVKEYPILSGRTFMNNYDFKDSLTLEPHSVSTRVLSFRSADGFEFTPYTEYEVTLGYLLNQAPLLSGFLQTSHTIAEVQPGAGEPRWQFCTYDTGAKKLIHTGSVKWNWWARFDEAHNGSCRT